MDVDGVTKSNGAAAATQPKGAARLLLHARGRSLGDAAPRTLTSGRGSNLSRAGRESSQGTSARRLLSNARGEYARERFTSMQTLHHTRHAGLTAVGEPGRSRGSRKHRADGGRAVSSSDGTAGRHRGPGGSAARCGRQTRH